MCSRNCQPATGRSIGGEAPPPGSGSGRTLTFHPQGAELIKLRFFAGLPNHQAAALLGVPERTAKRTWAFARAWLFNELQKSAK